MRPWFGGVLLSTVLTLAACSREEARPAKEAVAQAKAAAADVKDSAQAATVDAKAAAREAAAAVRSTVDDAKTGAEAAAVKADQAVTGASRAVQDGVATAAESTRSGAEHVAREVNELGQGGVVTGRVNSISADRLALRPEKTGPSELRLDSRTRYLLHGGAMQKGGLAAGAHVRATYVVEARIPIATEVEVLPK